MSTSLAYCKRWRLDRVQGVERSYVDTGPVVEHLRTLVAAGATRRGIAVLAGVGATTVAKLLDGRQHRCQRRTAARLLSITPKAILNRADSEGFVPALGSRRRIEALLAIGWRHRDITLQMRAAGAAGQRSQIVLHQPGEHVTRRTADAVRAAYRALATRPGPSTLTRIRAITAGYAPPAAWDNDIDDPAAAPSGMCDEHGAQSCGVRLAELEYLLACGVGLEQAAEQVGSSPTAIARAARRYGRVDLARRFEVLIRRDWSRLL